MSEDQPKGHNYVAGFSVYLVEEDLVAQEEGKIYFPDLIRGRELQLRGVGCWDCELTREIIRDLGIKNCIGEAYDPDTLKDILEEHSKFTKKHK